MTSQLEAQARTALSPEWDHGFDEAFAELISGDPGLVRAEFEALVSANFGEPPSSGPPIASAAAPEPGHPGSGGSPEPDPRDTGHRPDQAGNEPRPPP